MHSYEFVLSEVEMKSSTAERLVVSISCPGKGANLLAPCQNVDVCGMKMRDHDFEKKYKNLKHSYFHTCSRINSCDRYLYGLT